MTEKFHVKFVAIFTTRIPNFVCYKICSKKTLLRQASEKPLCHFG
jgi:hypothetical protein